MILSPYPRNIPGTRELALGTTFWNYQAEAIRKLWHCCLLNFFYCREILEESGLTTNELQEAGILKFEFVGEPEILEVHVFTTNKYEGTPTESEGKKVKQIY